MALTKEDIQFIDHYLEQSGVVFADIRMEMTDHIASATEEKMQAENQDFYHAFKDFMAFNKKEILKGNKESASFSMEVFKKFGTFLTKPAMLVFAILNFGMLTLFFRVSGTGIFNAGGRFFFSYILVGIALAQIALFYIILKKRFYYLEKSGVILGVLYYPAIFLLQTDRFETVNFYIIELFFYFVLAYVFYFVWETRTFYRLKNKIA